MSAEDAARLAEIQDRVARLGPITEDERNLYGRFLDTRDDDTAFVLAELAKAQQDFESARDNCALYRADAHRLDAEVSGLRAEMEALPEQIAQAIEGSTVGNGSEHYVYGYSTALDDAAAIARSFAASRPTPAPGDVDLQIAAAVLDGAARSFTPAPQETP